MKMIYISLQLLMWVYHSSEPSLPPPRPPLFKGVRVNFGYFSRRGCVWNLKNYKKGVEAGLLKRG